MLRPLGIQKLLLQGSILVMRTLQLQLVRLELPGHLIQPLLELHLFVIAVSQFVLVTALVLEALTDSLDFVSLLDHNEVVLLLPLLDFMLIVLDQHLQLLILRLELKLPLIVRRWLNRSDRLIIFNSFIIALLVGRTLLVFEILLE